MQKKKKIREKEKRWKKLLCMKVSKKQKETEDYGFSGLERHSQRVNLPHSNLMRRYFLRLNRTTIQNKFETDAESFPKGKIGINKIPSQIYSQSADHGDQRMYQNLLHKKRTSGSFRGFGLKFNKRTFLFRRKHELQPVVGWLLPSGNQQT